MGKLWFILMVLAISLPMGGCIGGIVQAGLFDKPAETVKEGVNKITGALTPATPVTPADDPTLLSTKPKPTPELYLSIARYQEEIGKPALAEQSYHQALRLSPKDLGVYLAYAQFKERQGQTQQALQLYHKAARFHPAEAAVFNDMGMLYARHGKNAEAMAALGRAIQIQPDRALYRNNMAALLVESGRPEEALKHLTAVYPEADACYKLGYLLQETGRTREAIDAFARALARNPSMQQARAWLDYLRATPRYEPQVARRLPSAGNVLRPRLSAERAGLDVPRSDAPGFAGIAETEPRPRTVSGGMVRELPPVLRPLPAPAWRGPDGPDTAPAAGLRRLPETSAQGSIARRLEEDTPGFAEASPSSPDVARLPPTSGGTVR